MAVNLQAAMFQDIRHRLDQMLNNASRNMDFVYRQIEKQATYNRSLLEGLEGLQAHLKAGKDIKASTIPLTNGANELFKDILQKYGIAFVSFKTKHPDQEVFVTKDTDAFLVSRAFAEVYEKLGQMQGEMSKEDFFTKYEGNKDIQAIENLSLTQVEYFRNEIHPSVDYTILRDKDKTNEYMIVYLKDKSELVEKSMNKTLFALSGEEGRAVAKRYNEILDERGRFNQVVKNNVEAGRELILADASDPCKFIHINDDGSFDLHQLDVTTNDKFDENGFREVEFNDDRVDHFKSMDKLPGILDGMHRPVLMTAKEFNLAKGFDYMGRVQVGDNFHKNLMQTKKFIATLPANRHYTVQEQLRNVHHPEMKKIKVFSNLPEEKINELTEYVKRRNLKETVIDAKSVACTDIDRKVIEKWMEENIYMTYKGSEKTGASPFITYEAAFMHENRGNLNISDYETMPKEQYIVDADNPSYLFILRPDSLTVKDNTGEFLRLENHVTRMEDGSIKRDESFDSQLKQIFDNFQNPIMLPLNELKGSQEEIQMNINARRPDVQPDPAIDALRRQIILGDRREFEEMFILEPEKLNSRQIEALETITSYKECRKDIVFTMSDAKDMYGLEKTTVRTVETPDMML